MKVMGSYTDNLFKRTKPKQGKSKSGRLVSAALIRDGVTHADAKSHAEIRRRLGDSDPYVSNRNDSEGFLTSDGTFLSRLASVPYGVNSGQLVSSWLSCGRDLLSSDIDW